MRNNICLWALYDFANSLASISVLFYFGPWFIVNKGGSDLWMSVAMGLATMLMVITLPFLGYKSDRTGRRIPFLSVMTFLCVLSLLGLGFVTSRVGTLTTPLMMLVITLYLLFHYFFQSGITFYNALMFPLTIQGSTPEKVSGFGMGIGQLGNVVGLSLLLPIAKSGIPFLSISGASAAFIVGGLLFLVFSMPMLFFFKEMPAALHASDNGGRWKTVRATIQDIRSIRRYPGVLAYLIAYYLFADAMLTITLFATTYLDAVAQMTDALQSMALIMSTALGIVGGLMSPYIVRLLGSCKRALTASIALWSILIVGMAIATTPLVFVIVIALNGLAFGALFALSRSFYATLIPADKQATLFSVYTLFERTASVLGPLLWSGVAFSFASFGPDRYRFSVFAMAIMVAISVWVLQFVRVEREASI